MKLLSFKSLTITLLFISHCVVAKVSTEVNFNEINVDAISIKGLVNELKAEAPTFNGKKVWALLQWDLVVEYRFKSSDDGCNFKVEEVEVIGDITLPNWQNIEKQKKSVQLWWQEFYAFIKTHEEKHFENVVAHASMLEETLIQAESFETCQLARQFYFAEKIAVLSDIKKEDLAIDVAARNMLNSNKELFKPIKDDSGMIIDSGFMNSFIGL